MFRTLYEAGINIELITTSEIRITCLIDAAQVSQAVWALLRRGARDSVARRRADVGEGGGTTGR
jgi:aspartate kinase